ncbi:MAG: hypothetical protein GY953_22695 [bacterium]|nr:hypothetical protein [bacterium]
MSDNARHPCSFRRDHGGPLLERFLETRFKRIAGDGRLRGDLGGGSHSDGGSLSEGDRQDLWRRRRGFRLQRLLLQGLGLFLLELGKLPFQIEDLAVFGHLCLLRRELFSQFGELLLLLGKLLFLLRAFIFW